jgi:hypothetical protein
LVVKVKEEIMANKRFWLGMFVMVLVFGMTVAGSAFGQDASLNGKWRSPKSRYGGFENDLCEYTFLAGKYETLWDEGSEQCPYQKGTYTTNNKGEIFLKVTHFYIPPEQKWYTKDEAIKYMKNLDIPDEAIKRNIENYYSDQSFVYSIENILGFQTLQLYQGREKSIYHKQ